ncbi:MAG: cytochrome b N-terminal domain-containing protein [Candidatus Eisenbacteria bacterium]|uniref:Cytochrome b N-terminal domain-containing protein n=1 Tax=Eiseniibacteriota bacterium TaxID=2212470 RepID=A0A933SFX0_UNCEI|nr:cytochrome b N-terminal domain-containing protein [Candidatus Eisenbacteria bacterium]
MSAPPGDTRGPLVLERAGAARARTPGAAALLRAWYAPLDRLFDRLYGSAWNPLYHTGPSLVWLLLVVIATGIYLLVFYRVGLPYESVAKLQSQPLSGRWLRALHRYASDLAVVFVVLHALRMMLEGRTWGPRVLAWVSGLALLGMMFVCGWTGYVLVWDAHGRVLGAVGARLFDSLHLMAAPVGRIFNGATTTPASFFFMNLFVHMSLPLVMAAAIWVHTLRLARGKWIPSPALRWGFALTGVAVSLVYPARLDPAADAMMLGDRATYDLFYTLWVPLSAGSVPVVAWAVPLAMSLLAIVVPSFWRPRRALAPEKSVVNPLACTACEQCVHDCPFEAIDMVADTTGRGPDRKAFVDPARCVACGACAASCESFAVGPPSRAGHAQMYALRALEPAARQAPEAPAGSKSFALASCASSELAPRLAQALRARGWNLTIAHVDCAGTLHPRAVAALAAKHAGVCVLGCPPARCLAREGADLSIERLTGGRAPHLKQPLDPTRVFVLTATAAELDEAVAAFERFAHGAGVERAGAHVAGRVRPAHRTALAAAAGALLFAGVAALGQVAAGEQPSTGAVRLAWRLPGQSYEDCRPLSAAEIARLPRHMRHTEECTTIYLHYRLSAWVDGTKVVDEEVRPLGARGDRPLYVERDLPLSRGMHDVHVRFEPLADPRGAGVTLEWRERVRVESGRAQLVTVDAGGRTLARRP